MFSLHFSTPQQAAGSVFSNTAIPGLMLLHIKIINEFHTVSCIDLKFWNKIALVSDWESVLADLRVEMLESVSGEKSVIGASLIRGR